MKSAKWRKVITYNPSTLTQLWWIYLFPICFHKSLQSYPTLFDPMDCSPPGSSVHEILQARILEWVAMPSFRGSSQPRDRTSVSYISCIGRQVFYHRHHLGSPSQKPTSTQLILERKNICGLTLHVMDRFSLNNVQRNIKNKSKKQNNQAPH